MTYFLKMERAWMYEASRIGPTFFAELATFIEAVTIHAVSKKTKEILCPCRDCKNQMLLVNPGIIRSHLLRRGFVDNYKIWVCHGEAVVTSSHDTCADQGGADDEGILEGDTDNIVMDGADDGDSDGEYGCDVDEDLLQEMLRHAESGVFFGSKNGLDDWESLQKAATDNLYEKSKGCAPTWTVMRFVLEMMLL